MKYTLLIFLMVFTVSCFAQDSTTPFKYTGQGKWLTGTDYVRQYDRDLAKLFFYDSAYAEMEKQNQIYNSIIDSLKDLVSMYQKIIEAKNNIIANKQDYINELEKPREIKINNKTGGNPLFSYDGIFFNLGTAYRFNSLNFTGSEAIKDLKLFGSLEAGFSLFNKLKLNLEVIIPQEIRLKGGIKL